MGSTDKYADIVLEGNDFDIVIEMKKPSVMLGDNEASQLISYMRVLGKKYGLLVGNKVKVFYDYDKGSSVTTEIASFDFDVDNSEGAAFCEILERSNCSSESLKKYASERLSHLEATKEFERLKKELIANNGEKIKEIVKNKLVLEGHEEKCVLDVLKDIDVTSSVVPVGGGMQCGLMQDEFEKWMIYEGKLKSKTAYQYKSSIGVISKHYSQQIKQSIDIYSVDDISLIKRLVKDYGKDGTYEDIGQNGSGNTGHGVVRNAIATYAKFLEFKKIGK
jgi:hypothetical protein